MNERIDRARIMELAERQVKAGRLEEAIEEYKKLLVGEGADPGINNIIGDLYVRLGRNDEAIKAFQAVAVHFESKGFYSQALAIYKKITKLDPENVIIIVRMADLLSSQGFIPEAKREYLRAEQKLKREKRVKELMFLYDKLIKLDRENVTYKINLADLFRQEGFIDEAVVQLNEAAEAYLRTNEPLEAEKIIEQTLWLKPEDKRALMNFIDVLRRTNRRPYAIELLREALKKEEGDLQFCTLLGSLYFEEQDLENAEEIFTAIVRENPFETRARIKLGKIYVLQNRQAMAFELFNPFITSLIKKGKEDKAIGLLGIVLSAEPLHLPALEKLAGIYKSRRETDHLEVIERLILEEARKKGLIEKMFVALAELLEIRPRDEDLVREYRRLRRDLGFIDEKTGEADMIASIEAEEADIDFLLTKADIYVGQGLIRNARRILETLSLRFPHSAKVAEKIAALEGIKPRIRPEEIRDRVEKVQEIETKIEAKPELARTLLSLLGDEEKAASRITSAEIFADTEILPLPAEDTGEKRYYDLGGKIEEEMGLLRQVFLRQIRGDISVLEKDLGEIVREFRDQVKRKVDTRDFETRFHLGLAYLEQGLFEEAIEEFLLASEDQARALECFSIISKAYRQKGDYDQAMRWLEECTKHAAEGTEESFAIDYERALLLEEQGNRAAALEIYRRIRDWNPRYRDVRQKIAVLS